MFVAGKPITKARTLFYGGILIHAILLHRRRSPISSRADPPRPHHVQQMGHGSVVLKLTAHTYRARRESWARSSDCTCIENAEYCRPKIRLERGSWCPSVGRTFQSGVLVHGIISIAEILHLGRRFFSEAYLHRF